MDEDAETIERVFSARAYARAKQAVDNAKSEDDASEWQKQVVFEVVEALTNG